MKAGVGTLVAERKPTEAFDGETYVQERGVFADVALVHAYKGDQESNLVSERLLESSIQLWPLYPEWLAIAEVEHLVRIGRTGC